MYAKVKDSYRWNSVRACGGAEFIKGEYRAVPPGREEEAQQADMLEFEMSVPVGTDSVETEASAEKIEKVTPPHKKSVRKMVAPVVTAPVDDIVDLAEESPAEGQDVNP